MNDPNLPRIAQRVWRDKFSLITDDVDYLHQYLKYLDGLRLEYVLTAVRQVNNNSYIGMYYRVLFGGPEETMKTILDRTIVEIMKGEQ